MDAGLIKKIHCNKHFTLEILELMRNLWVSKVRSSAPFQTWSSRIVTFDDIYTQFVNMITFALGNFVLDFSHRGIFHSANAIYIFGIKGIIFIQGKFSQSNHDHKNTKSYPSCKNFLINSFSANVANRRLRYPLPIGYATSYFSSHTQNTICLNVKL